VVWSHAIHPFQNIVANLSLKQSDFTSLILWVDGPWVLTCYSNKACLVLSILSKISSQLTSRSSKESFFYVSMDLLLKSLMFYLLTIYS
jgi:hypothetical protein